VPSSIGVFATARIIKRKSGEKVSLWTPDRPFLSSVEVEVGLSQNGLIRAVIDAPYVAGIKLLEERDLIVQSNILQVRMGYSRTGHMTPWYAGLMTTAGAEISPNGVSITIEAHGGAALAMTRQTMGTFTGKVIDIIKEVAAKFGWQVEPDTDAGLRETVTITGGGQSVWLFVEQLCNKYNYNFYMGTNTKGESTLFLVQGETWLAGTAKRTFVMYGNVDLSKNQYPLLSFSCDTKAVFLWQGSEGVQVAYIADDETEVVFTADETTTTAPSIGGGELNTSGKTDEKDAETSLAQDVVTDDNFAKKTVTPPSSDADAQKAAQAYFDRGQLASGFTIEAESIGVPLMQPGEVVGVYGVSSLYNGLYGVFKVTHSVGSDGFSTRWEGRRNAFPTGYGTDVSIVSSENTKKAEQTGETGI
jgi:phage protein D